MDSNFNVKQIEWRWALTLAIVILAITWLPYLYGQAIAPPDAKFMWLIGNPDDQNAHLMWARQAADGAWRFKDLYTTESHPGLFVNVFSLALGWTHRLTDISLHVLYQLARSVLVLGFVLVAYNFGALFFPGPRTRRLFVLLLCFSSGFGWLSMIRQWLGNNMQTFMYDVSPTLMMPEAFTFPSLCVAPLSIAGVTLAMITIGSILQYDRVAQCRWLLIGGVSSALLVNVHTYVILPLAIACALWLAMRRLRSDLRGNLLHSFSGMFFMSLIAAPALAYQLWTFSHDPVFAAKGTTLTHLPSLLTLSLSYGLVGLLALFGIGSVVNTAARHPHAESRLWLLPFAWLIAILIALHLPISFQRKMGEGLHVPLSLFAALALDRGLTAWTNTERTRSYITTLVIMLTTLSNFAFILLNVHWLTYNNAQGTYFIKPQRLMMPPYRLPRTTLGLLRNLRDDGDDTSGVLCSPQVGNYVPVLTGHPVFIGHWAESLYLARGEMQQLPELLPLLAFFYNGQMSVEDQRSFLKYYRIRYVLLSAYERAIGGSEEGLSQIGVTMTRSGDDVLYEVGP